MPNFMKCLLCLIVTLTVFSEGLPVMARADEADFRKEEMSFKNFITCELTRTDAFDHFGGKLFNITMIDLFDVWMESDIKMVTGAVQCFVENRYQTLYAAVGLVRTLGREQVAYYTIRQQDFSILATELMRYPYKERCDWLEYWIDTKD